MFLSLLSIANLNHKDKKEIQSFSFGCFLFHAAKPVANTLTPLKTSITTDSSAVVTINIQQQQQLPTKKRSAQVLGTDFDSISHIKKRNLNHRLLRLKQIKENHADNVAEIYFLQTGGNMMEYHTWRRKGVTPEFASFMKQYRLEPNSAETTSSSITTTTLSTATVQTVCQKIHSQNANQIQTQPPPLISTNSPHGKLLLCLTDEFYFRGVFDMNKIRK